VFGLLIIELSNYGNTSGNKVAYFTTADKRGTASGSLVVRADAGFWRSSAAISRVTVSPSAGNWAASVACLRLRDGFVMGLPLGGKPEPTPVTDADAVAEIPPDTPVRMEIDCATGAYRYIALSPPELKQRADDQAVAAAQAAKTTRKTKHGTRSPRSSRPAKQPTPKFSRRSRRY
jgi:hypothetical protein